MPRIEYKLTAENINDIICTALEGGINYWCHRATVKGCRFRGAKYASDTVSLGATLLLHTEGGEVVELNKAKLAKGVSKYLTANGFGIIDPETMELDCGSIDADMADCIVQLAVFGEIIYG